MFTPSKRVVAIPVLGRRRWVIRSDTLLRAAEEANIFIQYDLNANFVAAQDLSLLVKLLPKVPKNHKILLYGVSNFRGKGPGGVSPIPDFQETIRFFLTISFIFASQNFFGGFLEEMGKDSYRKVMNKIIEIKNKIKSKNAFALRFYVGEDKELIYVFQGSLTAEEAIRGYQALKSHYEAIKKNFKAINETRYIYNKKNDTWTPID